MASSYLLMPGHQMPLFNSVTTQAVDAADDGSALMFMEPRGTSAIVSIRCPIATVNGSPTALAQVEGVDTDGEPDGSALSTGVDEAVTQNTFHTFTLGTPYTPAKNEFVACAVHGGATIGGGDDFVIPLGGVGDPDLNQPMFMSQSGGAWSFQVRVTPISVVYADGFVMPLFSMPILSITQFDFDQGNSPNEYGNLWVPAEPKLVVGANLYAAPDQAFGDYDVVLNVDGTDEVVARTSTKEKNTGSLRQRLVTFDSFEVAASQNVRITMRPVNTTLGDVRLYSLVFPDSTARQVWSPDLQRTSSSDGSTYAEEATEMAGIFPIVQDVASSGGTQGISQGIQSVGAGVIA